MENTAFRRAGNGLPCNAVGQSPEQFHAPPHTRAMPDDLTALSPSPQRQASFHGLMRTRFYLRKRNKARFRYESCLLHEVAATDKLACQREDVTAFAKTEVIPKLLVHVHTKRGSAFRAVRCGIPPFIAPHPQRLVSEPCKKIGQRYLPQCVNLHTPYQLMMNFTPTPNCVWKCPVELPQRHRSRRLASRATRSAT